MAQKKKGTINENQYIRTQNNLDKKGKTNKKLKRNPMAAKFLTPKGKQLKEAGEKAYKESLIKNKEKATS